MGQCYLCGEDDGTIIFMGHLRGDAEAPRRMVASKEPCPKCRERMKLGVILIGVSDTDSDYRTGHYAVVKDEAIKRMIQPEEMAEKILRKRVAFVPLGVWVKAGLPTKNMPMEEKA